MHQILTVVTVHFIVFSLASNSTEKCLAVVHPAKGVVTFAWNSDGVKQGGRCYDVQRSFSLCDEDAIASKCFLARIPWQTPLSVVQCCFSCCLAHWQDRLGLNEVYNHWWSNKRFAKTEFSVKFDRRSIPGLNSTVLQFNSIKRFSMFMWEAHSKKSLGTDVIIHNATHLVRSRSEGGSVTVLHGKENPSKACSEPFDDRTLKYVQENHVSTIHVSDANCPRAVPGEGTTKDLMTRLKRFPRGGRFFTTNMYERLGDAITLPPPPPSRPGHRNTAKAAPKDIARDGHIITVPLGVRSTQFELLYRQPRGKSPQEHFGHVLLSRSDTQRQSRAAEGASQLWGLQGRWTRPRKS